MPRDHARIFTAIWGDDDFRALSARAQRLYALLLTQRELTYAGGLELRVQRWAGCAPDTTCDDIRAALAELVDGKFVVVDESTEELLVRAYLRRNEIWKQPKLLTLALRQAAEIQSRRLRSALRSELLRLPDDERADPAREFARTLPDTPWHTPADTPPGTPAGTHSETPTDTPTKPHPEPLPIPPRAYAVARVTSNQEPLTETQRGDLSGGVTQANARANPRRCPAHQTDPNPPPCGDCADARRHTAATPTPTPPPLRQHLAAMPERDPETNARGAQLARAALTRQETPS